MAPQPTLPRAHAIRVHYGPPIRQEEIIGLAPEAVVELIRARMIACQQIARGGLDRDLGVSAFPAAVHSQPSPPAL